MAATVTSESGSGAPQFADVDIGDLVDRLAVLEGSTIPTVNAGAQRFAYSAAFNASFSTAAAMNAQLATVATSVKLVQDNLAAQISTAVATALASQMVEIQSLLDTSDSNALTLLTAASRQLETSVGQANTSITQAKNAASGQIIGWKECAAARSDGADHTPYTYMECLYQKKRDDTILSISMGANFRQINGQSYWRFYVNGNQCEGPGGETQGDLHTGFHGSRSINNHEPMYLKGFCWKLRGNANAIIPAGNVLVEWRQFGNNADSSIGWESTSRIRVEEWTTDPRINYQTATGY